MPLLVFAAILGLTVAAPRTAPGNLGAPQAEIRLISQTFHIGQDGNYLYSYEQSNGQLVKEVGRVRSGRQPGAGSLAQQGEFQFVADDGQTYHTSYVADENGFQPQGAHLPRPSAQVPEDHQLRQAQPEQYPAKGR